MDLEYILNKSIEAEKENDKLKEENKKLRECVEFYAWESIGYHNNYNQGFCDTYHYYDGDDNSEGGGKLARKTLKELEEE